jgi:beta-N-acetylhexosaminidase
MVAHLNIPALDTTTNLASTLSPKVVNGLLKDSLGFEGITFTDALNMKGVSSFYKPGEVDLLAMLAGNDVMLFAENVPRAMDEICHAIAIGRISQEEIDARCRKMLHLKAWAGLDKYRPIPLKNLYEDLNNGQAKALEYELLTNAISLLINKNDILPIKNLEEGPIACLVIGDSGGTTFQRTLSRYAPIDHFTLPKSAPDSVVRQTVQSLMFYDKVIISMHGLNAKRPDNYGISQETLNLINRIDSSSTVILNVFGNPYALGRMPGIELLDAVLFSFEKTAISEQLAAQAIFGGIGVSGQLPVTANSIFHRGCRHLYQKNTLELWRNRLPEMAGMNCRCVEEYRAHNVNKAIAEKAIPGGQILVARNGMVVYEQMFGHHTYEAKRGVQWNDVYDIASITKIAASLASFMTLVDHGKGESR